MPELPTNGVRLWYEQRGDGPPVLLIHGTSSSARMWGEEVALLGRAIVYDRRGCTRSQRPSPYPATSVGEHAADAAALLEALAGGPAAVVGRGYGAEIAIDLALHRPELVRALVLLDPTVVALSPEAAAWDRSLRERVLADPAIAAETHIRTVLGDDGWERLAEPVRRMFAGNSPATAAEFAGGHLPVDRSELGRLRAPVLLAAAAHAPPAFRRITGELAAAIPGSRAVLVDGGHLISPADPAVRGFLAGLP